MRRTAELTKRARALFVEELCTNGWTPGLTVSEIAKAVGLTAQQVRDAIFGPASDEWRRFVASQIKGEKNASS